MELKDYYAILGLPANASAPEIKKAYRRLALQFHPDTNNNNPGATAQFAAIKEAYETLVHPAKKEFYLQQRWYQRSTGKKFSSAAPLTPADFLKKCLELNRYVYTLDPHRLDREGLSQYIRHILPAATISQLQAFNEPEVNQQIIISLLQTASGLHAWQLSSFSDQLLMLASDDNKSVQLVQAALIKHQQHDRVEKYRPFIIVAVVLAICLLIVMAARR